MLKIVERISILIMNRVEATSKNSIHEKFTTLFIYVFYQKKQYTAEHLVKTTSDTRTVTVQC